MLNVSIIDGYVDEPTCLGVPPYISPYPRYIAGAIWQYDKNARIFYVTIDQIRNNNIILKTLSKSDLIIVVAGMSVPGRYLSGFPASPNELVSFLSAVYEPVKILVGPAARYGFGISGGKKIRDNIVVEDVFDFIAGGDAEIVISELLQNNLNYEEVNSLLYRSDASAIKKFAIRGASIVKQHPYFPDHLITEIETYRGCARSIVGGCSFCSEPSKGIPSFRLIKDVISEVQALYNTGIKHFRIGSQPCIFSYMSKESGELEFPQPNPDAIEKLFSGIRTFAPYLKTLHIDNASPGVIARYPKECRCIAKTIIKYHTSGDVAAFGVESVDPVVIKKNNLKTSPDEIMIAIRLLNEVGSKRGESGLPELLPGLNFVFGLIGETKDTFDIDFEFLKQLYDNHLLVRRINVRQVIPIPNTNMYDFGDRNIKRHKSEFKRFKRKVREQIERPMLKRLIPMGTILKDVFTEAYDGKLTFGRQLGSYPLLVGIPGVLPLDKFIDVNIVDYGYRSITAVPYPLDINNANRETIEAIPGIGKKRASRIIAKRPFKNIDELIQSLDDLDVSRKLFEYINFFNDVMI
jgi:radical SAM superfamily enzyme with C-terminal helix-hairpin-helix motif